MNLTISNVTYPASEETLRALDLDLDGIKGQEAYRVITQVVAKAERSGDFQMRFGSEVLSDLAFLRDLSERFPEERWVVNGRKEAAEA